MSTIERLERDLGSAARRLSAYRFSPVLEELGEVAQVAGGTARIHGLPAAGSEELLMLGDVPALAFDLQQEAIGAVLLGRGDNVTAGSRARRTGRVAEVKVGDALLGRVVDALGHPLDGRPPPRLRETRKLEQPPPGLTERSPIRTPLHTGVAVIDALLPIGRGQRELIVGDRQAGKTSLALTAILSQRHSGVACIYCAIDQRTSAVAKLIAELRRRDAMRHTVVVMAAAEEPAGLKYLAPFTAMTMAEHWARAGRHVLLVLDDLTRHARAYRELSLLLRRPPGREAYPGDIFFLHARLLERAANLSGGGSVTALPLLEVEGQDLSAYIPTNLISISDGQVVLSEKLARRGTLPAVDVGLSVSRVGGKAQPAALRMVAGDVRLGYAQFEELEEFARFATRLDEASQHALRRGRRVRAALRQGALEPLALEAQLLTLAAVADGVLDDVPDAKLAEAVAALREAGPRRVPELGELDVTSAARSPGAADAARSALSALATTVLGPWSVGDG